MAAGDILNASGTPITFKSSGGTVLWTPTSVGFGAGRKSAQWDLGAAPRPFAFEWRAKIALQATPVVGEKVTFYMATSDGTIIDGTTTAGDAAFTDTNALQNMLRVGDLIVDTTTTDAIQGSGYFEIYSRYAILVMWNGTAAETLSATAGDHEFIATPVIFQSQS